MSATAAGIDRLLEGIGELLEAHKATGKRVDLTRYRGDIVGFAEQILKVQLTETQKAHLRKVQAGRRVAAYGANGVGKTMLDSIVALWAIYCWDALVIATSAKESQLTDQYMRDVRRLFSGAPELWGECRVLGIRRPDNPDSGLLCLAAGAANNLRSYHAPRMLVQLQECQGLPTFAFESAEIMAIGEWDKVTLTGNSNEYGGEFHKRCISPHWQATQFDARLHPNVVEGRTVIPGGPTRESIAERARQFGESSAFFRASVCGEFPEEGALEVLVRREWLEAAAERYESGYFDTVAAKADGSKRGKLWPFVAALDVARFGADNSALGIRQGPVLRFLKAWSGADTMQTLGIVQTHCKAQGAPLVDRDLAPYYPDHTRTTLLHVDVIGLGSGCYDRAKEMGLPVAEFNGSRTPPTAVEAERMVNLRASSFWHLRTLLSDGKIALPRNAQLFEELLSLRWEVASNGKTQIEGKDAIRQRLGRSPDLADAVAMCFSDFGKPPAFRVVPVQYA